MYQYPCRIPWQCQHLGIIDYNLCLALLQGILKEKCVVLFTLDIWNRIVLPGCPDCIYWFISLPRKNLKKHKNMEYTLHYSSVFICALLPLARQMALHTKARSTAATYKSRNWCRWQTQGIEGWVMLRKKILALILLILISKYIHMF